MLVRLTTLFLALSVAPALLAACDAGGADAANPTGEPTPDDSAQGDPGTTDPSAVAPDDGDPSVTDPVVDVDADDPWPGYPAGPYGAEYLDTIDPNLNFYDPWQGTYHYLGDFFARDDVKVLLISTGAGWCSACKYEAWDLVEVYDKYHAEGLEIMYTLFEDNFGQRLWEDPDRIDDDFTFMNVWKTSLGADIRKEHRDTNYPLYVDIGFQLGEYYDARATPMTLIVRTRDMKILNRTIGYSQATIDFMVKSVLYHPDTK